MNSSPVRARSRSLRPRYCARRGSSRLSTGMIIGLTRETGPASLARRLTAQRPPADVLAVVHPIEVDLAHGFVSAALRVGDSVAERRHAQHATAIGEECPAVGSEFRAALEHL